MEKFGGTILLSAITNVMQPLFITPERTLGMTLAFIEAAVGLTRYLKHRYGLTHSPIMASIIYGNMKLG